MAERLQDYESFWVFYVSEHRDATCRRLHVAGTGLVFVFLALAIAVSPWWLLAAPLAGYGFAWSGHMIFEKNRPATFTYPLWSLRADFRMFFWTLAGKMPAELARAAEAYPAPEEAAAS